MRETLLCGLQQLIVAHQNQRESELTMLKEGEFNVSKTREDVRKMNKEIQNSLQQQEVLQVSIVEYF